MTILKLVCDIKHSLNNHLLPKSRVLGIVWTPKKKKCDCDVVLALKKFPKLWWKQKITILYEKNYNRFRHSSLRELHRKCELRVMLMLEMTGLFRIKL